ncbi:MAG: hypothetical protein GX250_02745 [Clostridiales bacterium]|jgi:hypothetical protein|nr:hypothetical protein [Clostridiales bacterium]
MVKVIMGLKGSGKTKQLIDLVHKAIREERCVICIEKDPTLRYNIPTQARHVYTSSYGHKGFNFLKGFICGLHSGNYDINEIFIDGLYKIVDGSDTKAVDEFLEWLHKIGEQENINFTLTLSADPADATEVMKRFLI